VCACACVKEKKKHSLVFLAPCVSHPDRSPEKLGLL
jgi:hypothetical protein